jgi:hypothetical protein
MPWGKTIPHTLPNGLSQEVVKIIANFQKI